MVADTKPTVEQRLDIQELFAKYCWSLNTGDAEGYISLFTEDGWVDHKPQGRCQGRKAIQKLLNQIWYRLPYFYPGRQHWPHNFLITREGDNIRCKAYWTVSRLEQATNQIYVAIQGDWNALCVNESGDWKFKELTVTHWQRDTAPWVGDPEARMEPKGEWG